MLHERMRKNTPFIFGNTTKERFFKHKNVAARRKPIWEWIQSYMVGSIEHSRSSQTKKILFHTYNPNFLKNEEHLEVAIYNFAYIQHKMSNFGAL
uniref:Uncharacterized protein n=1 Tax=Parascaris univalens TaxID=6257 RepID=A0A914ZP00_PARUN